MKVLIGAAAAALVLSSAPLAFAGQQDFTLVNRTGYEIEQVYVSPSSAEDWEEDILGKDTLPNGERVDISFDRQEDTCKWDLKVVYADKDTAEWGNADLCSISVISIYYDAKTGETSAESE